MGPATIYKPLSFVPPLPDVLPAVSAFTFVFPPSHDAWDANAPAFIDARTSRTITRQEFRRLALSVAHGFRHSLNGLLRSYVPGARWNGLLHRGDTVLLFSPNSLAYPLAMHGAIAAGLRVSCANPAYTVSEFLHQFHDCEAKVVLAHPALVPLVLDALQKAGHSIDDARARCVVFDYEGLTGEKTPEGLVALDELMNHGVMAEEEKFDGKSADETAFLCYSSGTTGRAKGVMVRLLVVV
jgi:4-coumarate--CoA ligase